jgi:SulP family sulfate permease
MSFADAIHRSGRALLVCGAVSQPLKLMAQAEFHRHVGTANILPHIDAALARAGELHG